MKLIKLDINKHNIYKVSELIYETELSIFRPLIGKDRNEAIENIKMLIMSEKNTFSHENIHVVTDDNEEVLGILVAFKGDDMGFWDDIKAYHNILNLTAFLKYVIKGKAIDKLLTTSVGKNDYYLSNVAVNPACRGQGIGTFILENAVKVAKKRKCERVLLDVTFKNRAKGLYQRFGFRINDKNASRWIWADEGTYGMEYVI